jgi:eukaryotic-like serine/threonine-protein kinase
MSPENWQQVKTLLDACLERPAPERMTYLESACSDPEIRAEVVSLLAAHEDSTTFLEDLPSLEQKAAIAFQSNIMAGQKVGPYYLIEELGRGGMGTVYRAVRADYEFVLVVALKIVSRGMDTELVLRRFRNERQILASLEHPYIARLLDGGTTETGLPYFVMEYVEGLPILEYCDKHKLGVAERISLFRKVCDAVSYAHRNLIVHRDIKPGNILVTPDGRPKLLDFGIAGIVAGAPEDEEEGAVVLRMATPAYASPEQIRGGLVGTTSDVYSLGVILYEVLTGHSPYRLPKESHDVESLAQIICERDPTRASVVITSRETANFAPDDQPAEPLLVAEQRSTTVGVLRRKLHGDLDHILALALRKEPEQRYQSVDEFSADLRRYTESFPVGARKPTLVYRASKFASRHRMAVPMAALAVLFLFAATGFAAWKARQLAKRVAEDHRMASSFLVDIHDSIARLPGATPAREALLDRALQYLNGLAKDAADDPGLQKALAMAYEKAASLQAGTGGVGLGKETIALQTCMKARQIREQLAGAAPEDRQLQFELANNYLLSAFLVARTRSSDKRLEYDNKAMRIANTLVAQDPKNEAYKGLLARSELSMAYGMTFTADWAEGRKYLKKALEIRQKQAIEERESRTSRQELAHIYYRFGVNSVQSGHPGEGLGYLRQTLTIQTSLLREQPEDAALRSEIAANHHFTGIALGKLGQIKEALEQFEQAIAIRTEDLTKDPRDARSRGMLAGNYAERGTVQLKAGDYRGALASTWKAIELQESLYAIDPRAVPTRINLADFYSRLGAVQAAISSRERTNKAKKDRMEGALAAYRRADSLYASLRSDGHLKSSDLIADADHVHRALASLTAR